jgi:hypothetical protein
MMGISANWPGVEAAVQRDCFAALALTALDCHSEERSDEAIS